MEWLMIIAFIVISVLESKKKSDNARQQREKRQQMQGQSVYRTDGGSIAQPKAKTPAAKSKPASARPQPQKTAGSLMDTLSKSVRELEQYLGMDDAEGQPTPRKAAGGKTPQPGQKAAPAKKQKKAMLQTAKKSPADLPTQTLMEQRPDREQRETHTKVAASVKPLKNAFENQEQCEHRIELNPNIQYSKQKQAAMAQQAAIVQTDKDNLIQGIIWSEILGKPKAYQPNRPRFHR